MPFNLFNKFIKGQQANFTNKVCITHRQARASTTYPSAHCHRSFVYSVAVMNVNIHQKHNVCRDSQGKLTVRNAQRTIMIARAHLHRDNAIIRRTIRRLQHTSFRIAVVSGVRTPSFNDGAPMIPGGARVIIILNKSNAVLHTTRLIRYARIPVLNIGLKRINFLTRFRDFRVDRTVHQVTSRSCSVSRHVVTRISM